MVEQKRRVSYRGRDVDATSLKFTVEEEPWIEYTVEDGSKLKLRVITTEVLRVEGEFDPEGNPAYVLKSGNILVVTSPPDLREKG
jgi:hypothetical protein